MEFTTREPVVVEVVTSPALRSGVVLLRNPVAVPTCVSQLECDIS